MSLSEATALKSDRPEDFNLSAALSISDQVEAASRYLEAMERRPVDSEGWAGATAKAFDLLRLKSVAEAATPEWWNDEGLKALSARVVRAAANDESAIDMRAYVLSGGPRLCGWEVGPRSAAELREAATHYDRSAALCNPAWKAENSRMADWCRSRAEAL